MPPKPRKKRSRDPGSKQAAAHPTSSKPGSQSAANMPAQLSKWVDQPLLTRFQIGSAWIDSTRVTSLGVIRAYNETDKAFHKSLKEGFQPTNPVTLLVKNSPVWTKWLGKNEAKVDDDGNPVRPPDSVVEEVMKEAVQARGGSTTELHCVDGAHRIHFFRYPTLTTKIIFGAQYACFLLTL